MNIMCLLLTIIMMSSVFGAIAEVEKESSGCLFGIEYPHCFILCSIAGVGKKVDVSTLMSIAPMNGFEEISRRGERIRPSS